MKYTLKVVDLYCWYIASRPPSIQTLSSWIPNLQFPIVFLTDTIYGGPVSSCISQVIELAGTNSDQQGAALPKFFRIAQDQRKYLS